MPLEREELRFNLSDSLLGDAERLRNLRRRVHVAVRESEAQAQ